MCLELKSPAGKEREEVVPSRRRMKVPLSPFLTAFSAEPSVKTWVWVLLGQRSCIISSVCAFCNSGACVPCAARPWISVLTPGRLSHGVKIPVVSSSHLPGSASRRLAFSFCRSFSLCLELFLFIQFWVPR